ncbi:hypothetical protein BVX95_01670 [archaeon D22]|nr:hypothetical protein BVX95_01670 [archaeon D22]
MNPVLLYHEPEVATLEIQAAKDVCRNFARQKKIPEPFFSSIAVQKSTPDLLSFANSVDEVYERQVGGVDDSLITIPGLYLPSGRIENAISELGERPLGVLLAQGHNMSEYAHSHALGLTTKIVDNHPVLIFPAGVVSGFSEIEDYKGQLEEVLSKTYNMLME